MRRKNTALEKGDEGSKMKVIKENLRNAQEKA
jgi:hypothetical protein